MKTFYTNGTEKPHEIKNLSGATIVALEIHKKVLQERVEKESWHLFCVMNNIRSVDETWSIPASTII